MFHPDPWHVQPPDDVQRPISVNADIVMPNDANTSDQATLVGAAQNIVNQNSTMLHRWINGLRQQVSLSGSTYSDRQLDMPGMTVKYGYNHGQERLHMQIRPVNPATQVAPQTYDLNNDGYVVFILYDPNYPNTVEGTEGYPKSYDLYMNGYLIKQGFLITGPCTAFVVMFGLTALRCQSLADPNNPLATSQALDEPASGLFPKVVPKRAQVSGHDDIFAYNLFNFTDVLNPNYSQAQLQEMILGATPVKVNVTGGIQFFDPTNSPLNTKQGNSINYFGVCLSYGLTQTTEDPVAYFQIAEFYSRKTLRGVKQSWRKTTKSGSIVVNDKPLYWGNTNITSYTALVPGQNAFGFDLYNDNGGSSDPLAPTALTGAASNSAQFNQALNATDAAALSAYLANVSAAELAFANQQLPAIQAAIANVASVYNVYQNDNYKLKQATSAVANDQNLIAVFSTLNPTIYAIVVQEYEEQLVIDQQSVVKFTNQVAQDLVVYNAANLALQVLEAQKPTLPPQPVLYGNNIDSFKYREVTVNGTSWSFGDWQGD